MIDLHTHILPGIDDGSPDAAVSHEMLRTSCEHGVKILALTPHFDPMQVSPQEFLQQRQAAFERLQWQQDMPQLLLGAEVAYFPGISRCQELELLKLADTNLVLVEMPFTQWTTSVIQDVSSIRRETGLTPILAHFERYRKMRGYKEGLQKLMDAEVLLQCNAAPLLQFFGARSLIRMIRDGQVHFLGTDCHNMDSRPPRMAMAAEKLRRTIGEEAWNQFNENALQLLHSFQR